MKYPITVGLATLGALATAGPALAVDYPAPTDPGQDTRHVGTIEPLWNLFDLTREGRLATWHEQFSY